MSPPAIRPGAVGAAIDASGGVPNAPILITYLNGPHATGSEPENWDIGPCRPKSESGCQPECCHKCQPECEMPVGHCRASGGPLPVARWRASPLLAATRLGRRRQLQAT